MNYCRHCGAELSHVFLDLGYAPPTNDYLSKDDLSRPEVTFPLKIYVCDRCWLVQTEDYSQCQEIFRNDYAYFSSVSGSWLQHASDYVAMITRRLALTRESFVIELASNDGYLLRNFVASGIPCLGIEPTGGTAEAAEKAGIEVMREFFGGTVARGLAEKGRQADLIIGNNVYAHVPDINDFTAAMKIALKPGGTITLEFPHLLNLMRLNQFDTVYHEHYSYLSLQFVQRIFSHHGLKVYDVEELPTHGGSLRVYGCHAEDPKVVSESVLELLSTENAEGMANLSVYQAFQAKADRVKNDFVAFLIEQKRLGKTVGAYGAASKGSTLLNYGGVKPDLMPYVCDAAPSKQGKYLPGSHVPILPPSALAELAPDYVVIFPWNIAEEIKRQLDYVKTWGGKFITAVPELQIHEA
ncbi:MAG: class I SAM-dependent methyltransferase [Chlorobiaceae bacterium]|nr:class I SAM-dependent methyltransferase [Chlorobiaceae bacterium]